MPKRINLIDLAVDFLRQELGSGKKVARGDLMTEGKNRGFSRHTMHTAANRLNVISEHDYDSFRTWRMPNPGENK